MNYGDVVKVKNDVGGTPFFKGQLLTVDSEVDTVHKRVHVVNHHGDGAWLKTDQLDFVRSAEDETDVVGEYFIEVYETHVSQYRVEAMSVEDAVAQYMEGLGETVDDSEEFVETDMEKGFRSIRVIETPDGRTVGWEQLKLRLGE